MNGAPLSRREQATELLRFGLVGGSAVTVDFLVYFALLALVPAAPTSIAKAVSFIAGAVLAFALNRTFVFRAGRTAATRQAPGFAVLYLVTLALNNAVNAAALAAHAPKPVAWLAATAASTIGNFLGMKLVVFRR